jgi:hypothetical protein
MSMEEKYFISSYNHIYDKLSMKYNVVLDIYIWNNNKYQLKHCGNRIVDKDNDGIPCESICLGG